MKGSFSTSYTVQMPKGTMLFDVTFRCRQLDTNDDVLGFSLKELADVWFGSEEAAEYRGTPHSLVLGFWMKISDTIKQNERGDRGLVCCSVRLIAPGMETTFGVN